MSQQDAIAQIAQALQPLPEVSALFLSGSHGNGLADAYSDLDFTVVAPDGATDALASQCRKAVELVGDPVLWRDRIVAPVLINAVLAGGLRIDLLLLKPDQMGHHRQDALKPVFDRNSLYSTLKPVTEPAPQSPARLRYQFDEFIRILGLLPLVIGRQEHLNGLTGIFHLRNILVEQMIAETGAKFRGGALHLNRLITDAQKAALAALPLPEPNRDSLIAAHLAYATAYIPRARAFAARQGVDWPEAFETATWQLLQRDLGIARPA